MKAEKKHFKEILPFDRHSTANLPLFAILKKFQVFEKKPSIFSKKNQIWNVLRNRTILVAFYGKCATIW